MKNSKFYLIESKNDIFKKVKDSDSDLYDLFTSKQIWEDVSEDYRGWSSVDYLAKTKLSFLLAIHTDYSEEEYFSIFFPGFAFSQSYFDRCWDITEIDIFENSENRAKESFAVDQAAEQFENDKVKDWLLSLKT